MSDSFDTEFNLTKGIFAYNTPMILKDIPMSKYPKSSKAIFSMQRKIDGLLKGILFLREEDYYTSQAYSRVILEHFIVGHYIFIKTKISQNDTCGIEYYREYFISEFFKRENFDLSIDSISKNQKEKQDILDVLKSRNPDYTSLTIQDLQDVHSKPNQFDVRRILRYLCNDVPHRI